MKKVKGWKKRKSRYGALGSSVESNSVLRDDLSSTDSEQDANSIIVKNASMVECRHCAKYYKVTSFLKHLTCGDCSRAFSLPSKESLDASSDYASHVSESHDDIQSEVLYERSSSNNQSIARTSKHIEPTASSRWDSAIKQGFHQTKYYTS